MSHIDSIPKSHTTLKVVGDHAAGASHLVLKVNKHVHQLAMTLTEKVHTRPLFALSDLTMAAMRRALAKGVSQVSVRQLS